MSDRKTHCEQQRAARLVADKAPLGLPVLAFVDPRPVLRRSILQALSELFSTGQATASVRSPRDQAFGGQVTPILSFLSRRRACPDCTGQVIVTDDALVHATQKFPSSRARAQAQLLLRPSQQCLTRLSARRERRQPRGNRRPAGIWTCAIEHRCMSASMHQAAAHMHVARGRGSSATSMSGQGGIAACLPCRRCNA